MKRNNAASGTLIPEFETVTGRIRYKLTNDFMFHVVFDENRPALRMLLSSLLHMKPEEIKTVEVRNSLDYGTFVT